MIRAKMSDGTMLLGIDAENVRRLKNGQPIRVRLSDHGGTDTVVICYGETLAALMIDLQSVFGPLPPIQPFIEGETKQ